MAEIRTRSGRMEAPPRPYEPVPSPGQLRVGEDLPAALGVFTQLDAVFGARRHTPAQRRLHSNPADTVRLRRPVPRKAAAASSRAFSSRSKAFSSRPLFRRTSGSILTSSKSAVDGRAVRDVLPSPSFGAGRASTNSSRWAETSSCWWSPGFLSSGRKWSRPREDVDGAQSTVLNRRCSIDGAQSTALNRRCSIDGAQSTYFTVQP